MCINIAIADDHPVVIRGLRNVLHEAEDICICDTYATGAALLEGLARRQPDVLMLDIQLPDKKGNELARIIHRSYPGVGILVFTSTDTLFHVKDMMQHGCRGYLLKNTDQATLLTAIRQVYAGEPFLESQLRDLLLRDMTGTNAIAPELTRREQEVLRLISEEYTSQEIADKLFISVSTVESHRFSLFRKLGVKNSVGLIKVAIQTGLLNPEPL